MAYQHRGKCPVVAPSAYVMASAVLCGAVWIGPGSAIGRGMGGGPITGGGDWTTRLIEPVSLNASGATDAECEASDPHHPLHLLS